MEDNYQYLRIDKDVYNALEIGFLREENKEISEITLIRTNSYKIINAEYFEKDEYEKKTLSLTKKIRKMWICLNLKFITMPS